MEGMPQMQKHCLQGMQSLSLVPVGRGPETRLVQCLPISM